MPANEGNPDRTNANYSYGSVSIAFQKEDSNVESFTDTARSKFNGKKPPSLFLRSILFLFLATIIAAACFFLQPKQEVGKPPSQLMETPMHPLTALAPTLLMAPADAARADTTAADSPVMEIVSFD